jgi:uncharacterized protein (DUF1499 family)
MLGWLMGLIFPACAQLGTGGLPPPMLIQFAGPERVPVSRSALAASPNTVGLVPEIALADFPVPAARLRAAVAAVAAAQPRTFAHGSTGAQDHWVARSELFNFPDLVTAQVFPRGEGAAALVLYSRSVYGESDLGANRKRLETWLAQLPNQLRD